MDEEAKTKIRQAIKEAYDSPLSSYERLDTLVSTLEKMIGDK